VLGFDIGLARALGAVLFAFIVGLAIAGLFRKDEEARADTPLIFPGGEEKGRLLWKTTLYFACMVLFLVFSDWYNPGIATVKFKDGTQMKVHVRYETQDTLTLQLYNEAGKVEGEVKTYNKSENGRKMPLRTQGGPCFCLFGRIQCGPDRQPNTNRIR